MKQEYTNRLVAAIGGAHGPGRTPFGTPRGTEGTRENINDREGHSNSTSVDKCYFT